jgi:hypothetical protein
MHLLQAAPELTRRLSRGWQERALCATSKDPEAWFPAPRTPEEHLAEPLRTCAACPVRRPCLIFGLLNGESGLWGGVTDDDRAMAASAIDGGADFDDVLDLLVRGELWRLRQAG